MPRFIVGTCENIEVGKCADLAFCVQCEQCDSHCLCEVNNMTDAEFAELIQ